MMTAMVDAQPSGRLERFFRHPRAPAAIAVLAGVLGLATLTNGLLLDDLLILDRAAYFDVFAGFNFVGGEPLRIANERVAGTLPWWTADGLSVQFLRPLAMVSHGVDMLLWPGSPVIMHLQNILWYVLLVVLVGRVYRQLWPGANSVGGATLAMLVFAIDDAHALNVGWLATRHSLMGGVLAVAALLAHLRRGEARVDWIGPLLFALALCASETALAILGYIVADIWLRGDPGTRGRNQRVVALVPYAVVTGAWFACYQWLGAGASGCGLYLDPRADFVGFLAQAGASTSLVLGSQFGPPGIFELMVFVPGGVGAGAIAAAVVLAAVFWVCWPVIKQLPQARFFAVGMLLAAIPHAATMPSDRYLLLIGIGGAGLLASVMSKVRNRELLSRVRRVCVWVLVALHVVIAGLLFVPRSVGMTALHNAIDRAAQSMPDQPNVVLLQAPGDLFPLYAPAMRARAGVGHPGFHVVYAGSSGLKIERVDADTLRVEPLNGFFAAPGEQVFADSFSLAEGETRSLPACEIEVAKRDADGTLRSVLVHLKPGAQVMAWGPQGPVAADLPDVGQSQQLAPVAWAF